MKTIGRILKGKKQGPWKYFHRDGKLLKEKTYRA